MDRISGLPEPIQHDILSFLEEDEIAGAAVLSKAWRSIVQTRPVLVSDQHLFRRKRGSYKLTNLGAIVSEDLCFMNHVDEFIQKLAGQDDQTIQKFSLVTELYDIKSCSHCLDRWIQQVVEAKLKVLSLCLKQWGPTYVYVLSPSVFLSDTITNLRLSECNLGQCNYMRLPHLIELSLLSVTLSQDMIHQMSSGCPNLKILHLICCRGFSSIFVSGLARLHEVEFNLGYRSQTDVKVVAPMLRVFKVYYLHFNSKIDLLGFESTLRSLTLYRVDVTAEGLRRLVSKFIGLEELKLDYLRVEIIEIPNQKLLKLEVSRCSRLDRSVRIDAPNLCVLRYYENNLFFYPVSISPNCMIDLCGSAYSSMKSELKSYIHDFKEPCLKARGFTNMKMIVSYGEQEVIVCQVWDENVMKTICDSLTMGLIVKVEHTTNHERLPDRLFSSSRWKAISIVSRDRQSNRKLLEVLSKETLKEREEEPNCCRYKSPKCWRHSLYALDSINEETTMAPNLLNSFVAMGCEIARIKPHWISGN